MHVTPLKLIPKASLPSPRPADEDETVWTSLKAQTVLISLRQNTMRGENGDVNIMKIVICNWLDNFSDTNWIV